MMKSIKLFAIFILCFNVGLFAKSVATVTAIKGDALIQRDTQSFVAKLGSKLEQSDSIITKEKTKVQLIFSDDTVISIGQNSHFSIKEYMFEDGSEPVARFGMISGAMRTITGKIGKIAPQKFSVETKTATIGIRGTNFSIVIGNDGDVNAYCTYGAISASVKGTIYIVKQGFFISISIDGSVEIKEFSSEDLKKMKKKNFALNKDNKKSFLEKGEGVEDGYLELIAKDESKIIISDLDETNTDNIINKDLDSLDPIDPNEILTDSSIIAGYSMNNALYTGTYSTTSNTGSFSSSGSAELSVDFGAETANLILNGDTLYNFFNVNSNTVTGSQSGNIGSAEAKFYGESGNTVNGTFTYGEYVSPSDEITAEGTFSVETSQDLN